jgi:hypothetical protein
VLLALGVAALLPGCTPDSVPVPLRGAWYSDDQRFDDRRLEIQSQWIRFLHGPEELSAIRVARVSEKPGSEGRIEYELDGSDREGERASLRIELQQRPTEMLRLATQRAPWRRQPRHGPQEAP